MKNQKPRMLHIDISSSEDLNSCLCECKTTISDEKVLGALLAGAVVSVARNHSRDPHKFANLVAKTIVTAIDIPDITKPNQKLS